MIPRSDAIVLRHGIPRWRHEEMDPRKGILRSRKDDTDPRKGMLRSRNEEKVLRNGALRSRHEEMASLRKLAVRLTSLWRSVSVFLVSVIGSRWQSFLPMTV